MNLNIILFKAASVFCVVTHTYAATNSMGELPNPHELRAENTGLDIHQAARVGNIGRLQQLLDDGENIEKRISDTDYLFRSRILWCII
jgi:hypothetical protein